MHQSWMLFIQRKSSARQFSGTNFISSTFSTTCWASGLVFTNHCLDIKGSTMLLQRWQRPSDMVCGSVPRSRPSSARRCLSGPRTLIRSCPWKGPAFSFSVPSRLRMLRNWRLWRLPDSKSSKLCAGVTFTAPVPNFGSTSSASPMMGNSRPVMGWRTFLPIIDWYRGSSGCTATAVSPSIVSGRVVATTISPLPSASG